MVTVDTIAKVRRAYFVQKRKIKAIARDLKLARNTVREIIRGEQRTEHHYVRRDPAATPAGQPCCGVGAIARRERNSAQARAIDLSAHICRASAGWVRWRLRRRASLRTGMGGTGGRARGGRLRAPDLRARGSLPVRLEP